MLKDLRAVTAGPIILEILAGTKDEWDFQRIRREFMALELISTSEESWREAAHLQFALRRKGVAVPHMDALIATLAIESDCVLLHSDRHFDLIARHSRLRAERLG